MTDRIYFDNNATTPIDQRVLEAIIEELKLSPSNPSSIHQFGQMAKARLSNARYSIAKKLNVQPDEIIFNSGATEGLNSLIRKYFECFPEKQIISSNIEHSCVYKTLKQLQSLGCDVLFLDPNDQDFISKSRIENSISNKTGLVVLSAANSETGVKNDINLIADFLNGRNINFIVDAVAAYAKDHFDISKKISALAFSGHKFHGPQGIGFIIKRKSFKLGALITGGEQEFSSRAGTENLPGIIGIAKAVELVDNDSIEYIKNLRQTFESEIINNLDEVWINGKASRVSNISNIGFGGVDGESLLINLDLAKIAASHGSACSSGAVEPSRVLLNMGQSYKTARSSIRFSFSRMNTIEEVKKACNIIIEQVNRLRNL